MASRSPSLTSGHTPSLGIEARSVRNASAFVWMPWTPMAWLSSTIDASPVRKPISTTLKQVDVVRDLVGDVSVKGGLCFIEAAWPLVGGAFSTHGVHLLWPKRLAKVLMEQTVGGV